MLANVAGKCVLFSSVRCQEARQSFLVRITRQLSDSVTTQEAVRSERLHCRLKLATGLDGAWFERRYRRLPFASGPHQVWAVGTR